MTKIQVIVELLTGEIYKFSVDVDHNVRSLKCLIQEKHGSDLRTYSLSYKDNELMNDFSFRYQGIKNKTKLVMKPNLFEWVTLIVELPSRGTGRIQEHATLSDTVYQMKKNLELKHKIALEGREVRLRGHRVMKDTSTLRECNVSSGDLISFACDTETEYCTLEGCASPTREYDDILLPKSVYLNVADNPAGPYVNERPGYPPLPPRPAQSKASDNDYTRALATTTTASVPRRADAAVCKPDLPPKPPKPSAPRDRNEVYGDVDVYEAQIDAMRSLQETVAALHHEIKGTGGKVIVPPKVELQKTETGKQMNTCTVTNTAAVNKPPLPSTKPPPQQPGPDYDLYSGADDDYGSPEQIGMMRNFNRYFTHFLRNFDIEIADSLLEEEVLSPQEHDDVCDTTKSKNEQARLCLRLIRRKGDRAVEQFHTALLAQGMQQLADRLEYGI